MKKKSTLIEIWGDIVLLHHLVIAIVIISITTMIGHLQAPANSRPLGLLFGLSGALIGFAIITFIFRPKRIIQVVEEEV